jgi:polysaccharide biosynthesis protein PslG
MTADSAKLRLTFFLVMMLTFSGASLSAGAAAQSAPLRGVDLHSLWPDETSSDVSRELDLAASAGSNTVRVDVGWASIEPRARGVRNSWYVRRMDRLFAAAAARRIKVIVTLWATPCWASTAPRHVLATCNSDGWSPTAVAYPPADVGEYARIVRWLESRYGSHIAALEVWNEPNLASQEFWRGSPAQYAALLRAAYPASTAAGRHVPVLAGALAGVDIGYLASLYAAGIRGFYDGLSIHPYGPAESLAERLGSFRAAELAAGDSAALWLTEIGWSTANGPPDAVSENAQATQLRTAFGVIDRLAYVRAATVYSLRDDGTDLAAREDNFGLVRRDFSAKPALEALRSALAVRRSAPAATTHVSRAAKPRCARTGHRRQGLRARRRCASAGRRTHS